jgi:hypothetical protein
MSGSERKYRRKQRSWAPTELADFDELPNLFLPE